MKIIQKICKMKIWDLEGQAHDIECEHDDNEKIYGKIGYVSTRIELSYTGYEIFIFTKDEKNVVEIWDSNEMLVMLLARNPSELTDILLKFSQIVKNLVESNLLDQKIYKMDDDK